MQEATHQCRLPMRKAHFGPKLRTSRIGERMMSENRENRPHVLLLTGTPGIGKTTVIRRAADRLKDKGLRGFYTEEIREKGERRGFRLVSFEGTTQTIAHVDFPKRHRVASTALTSRRSTVRQPCYGPTPKRACTSWTRSARWSAFPNASLRPCAS